LSFAIIGILIEIHKELGPYAREKQYCDLFEKILKERGFTYKRELRIADTGNILDFEINHKIIVEFKTVAFLTDEHYNQVKRYLHQTGLKLGILVNFRDQRIKPKRILNINNLRHPDNS
jgi:GxxExxY protein